VTTDRRSQVQSVARAGEVLETLRVGGPLSARQIGDALGVDRTVAYRLLKTLEPVGLVEVQGTSWRLGVNTLRLGMAYLDGLPFASIAPAFAIDLHRRVVGDHPWLVSLGVPVRDRVVLIDRFWGQHSPLSSIVPIGTAFPMIGSATGHAILSAMSQETAHACVGAPQLVDIGDLLDRVRDDGGLAFAHDILRPGVSAIAAAVHDRRGQPVGAVNVSGTDLEEHLAPTSDVARHVKRTADSITAALQ
jgi:DNA-binding IclR family transcriptional regulator